jgi:hypothetical protein
LWTGLEISGTLERGVEKIKEVKVVGGVDKFPGGCKGK